MSKLRGEHARVEKDEERPARESSPPANGSGKWVRCKLTAELVEDAHPGSGSGAAGVDALVARDREERPVIWASHLESVLRDAARRLRHDSSEMLFGKAGGQRQRFILTSLYVAQDPGCRVWRSAARDSFENRAPKDDTLRAVEFVPKGTRFEGSVELSAGDVPLLDRLIAEVDAIGRGRAAGEGRVKLTLAETKLNPRPVGRATSRLLLLLRNIDPISVTATATPTNLIPALPFIPGRSLLGALAEWLWADNEQDAATKLVSGRISVSDALPLPKQPTDLAAVDVSPAPLSLRSEKPLGTSGETPWWALPTRLHGGSINGWRKTRTTSRRRSSNAPRRIYLCAASDPVLRGQLIVRLFEFGFETGVPIPLSRIRHCSRLSKSQKVRCSLRRFRETLQRWQLWETHSARYWKAAAGSELVVGAHRSKSSARSGLIFLILVPVLP